MKLSRNEILTKKRDLFIKDLISYLPQSWDAREVRVGCMMIDTRGPTPWTLFSSLASLSLSYLYVIIRTMFYFYYTHTHTLQIIIYTHNLSVFKPATTWRLICTSRVYVYFRGHQNCRMESCGVYMIPFYERLPLFLWRHKCKKKKFSNIHYGKYFSRWQQKKVCAQIYAITHTHKRVRLYRRRFDDIY